MYARYDIRFELIYERHMQAEEKVRKTTTATTSTRTKKIKMRERNKEIFK